MSSNLGDSIAYFATLLQSLTLAQKNADFDDWGQVVHSTRSLKSAMCYLFKESNGSAEVYKYCISAK